MQEATPTHNIISLRAMFAQYYNSAKGTSAKWLKDQRRGCQEGERENMKQQIMVFLCLLSFCSVKA